ncbi:signal transduction histidine kinase [Bacillus tianshenii]|uniref:Heme sensor protein HssS n=1 Tax=Sutcliffiella tianshenii TaxID=1463404 RepID=A0ABS2NZ83_9BACI|nr:HAMP domain-containing sensor histidine kinase [Bacillus tianshenii]MBM7620020.1 signal transduction histidine kinase [Bacillus tianshenii]
MKSLYTKFVFMTIGIMIVSGVLAFFISNAYYQQKLKPENDEKTTRIAQSIALFADEHPDVSLNEYLENVSSIGYQLYLVDNSGEAVSFGAAFKENGLSTSTMEAVLAGNVYHGILQYPQELFVTGFFANDLNNTIGVPLTHKGENYALFVRPDIKLLFNEMHYLFAWLLLLTILLSIVMVVFSAKYLVKPIAKLTKATTSLSKGDFNVKLDSNRHDELGELSRSFERMAKQLGQMDDMRKEFISNISHDIQSPLSNIKGYTTLLEKETISPEERSEYISIIQDETNRLSILTKQLLLLASLDRDDSIVKKTPFNVGQQLRDLVRNYQWLVSDKGMMLSYSLPDTEIIGDPSLLHTVWDNLLSNAIKYNKDGGLIDLIIEDKEDRLLITFKDTGMGLSPAEVERIFDRFYRADAARTRTIEGTGLGLSIVAKIVKLHGGRIHVTSKVDEGTSFVVELPVG